MENDTMATTDPVLTDDAMTTDPGLPTDALADADHPVPGVSPRRRLLGRYGLVAAYLSLTGVALLLSALAVVVLAAVLPGGALSTAFVLTVGLGFLAASPAAARWAFAAVFDVDDSAPSARAADRPATPEERRRNAGPDADFWR